MRVDVWSDIACPWCWLGKHHLEEAVRRLGLEPDVEIVYRSFELDPRRAATEPSRVHLARKYGDLARIEVGQHHMRTMGERVGIHYDFERQRTANTFDAHRLHHLAQAHGLGDPVLERLMQACHGEGADMSDRDTLRRVAVEAGLAAADVDRVLASDDFAAAVRADEAVAKGIQGVPFFVFDDRLALSGAQPVETFEAALGEAFRTAGKAEEQAVGSGHGQA